VSEESNGILKVLKEHLNDLKSDVPGNLLA